MGRLELLAVDVCRIELPVRIDERQAAQVFEEQRRGVLPDLEGVGAACLVAVEVGQTEVPDRRTLDSRWLPGHRWIAEIDGQIAGWTAVSPTSSRDCYAGVGETSVYVGEDFRRRGVGKTLLHKQVTAADAGGLWTLQTAVFPENRASLALHHSAGYRTLGVRERVAQHHGVWRDTVLLERRSAVA